jgi:hypothetical protein
MLFTLFTLLKVNADFQMDPSQNYEEKDLPGQANPAICGAQITQRYGCLRRRWSNLLKTRRRNFQTRRQGGVRNEVCFVRGVVVGQFWCVVVNVGAGRGSYECTHGMCTVQVLHCTPGVACVHLEWRVYTFLKVPTVS